MKKRFWKLEYSITLFIIIGIVLLMIPMSFISPHGVKYISDWNDTYTKIDYMFTAMNIQTDRSKKFSKSDKEKVMLQLVKPYLRISENDAITKNYATHYMNGARVKKKDLYYFDNLYKSNNGIIFGIKDIENEDIYHPGFIMMFDMNGRKKPNIWGKDIYGINIFLDGKISPIGSGWDISELKKDCSPKGRGVACSHYYRIGGEFIE